jgi:hypothetical protein
MQTCAAMECLNLNPTSVTIARLQYGTRKPTAISGKRSTTSRAATLRRTNLESRSNFYIVTNPHIATPTTYRQSTEEAETPHSDAKIATMSQNVAATDSPIHCRSTPTSTHQQVIIKQVGIINLMPAYERTRHIQGRFKFRIRKMYLQVPRDRKSVV